MTDPFDPALALILKSEGGYVNNPRDPGGMTNLGVTRRVWEDWCGHVVSEADMRGLTPAKVAPVYRARYWNALHCDSLPGALALCVFDFGVNAGISRAARYLQMMAGASPDGHIGQATLRAVQQYATTHGLAEAVRTYQQERRAYYRSLSTFPTFGKGWLRRVDETETAALKMV